MSLSIVSRNLLRGDNGSALIMVLMAVSFFSLVSIFMLLNASTGLQISDNCESQMQASYAALSGINHARSLLRGISFDDLLKGPDGACDRAAPYIAQARTIAFRNPFSISVAQSLDLSDPSAVIAGISDDGIINTGFYAGVQGIALIPLSGIAQWASNPQGPGLIITSRYFVKVSDNNASLSEIAGDPQNDPFFDGDGIITIRSMGVARAGSESTGAMRRNNSVVIFEARMKRSYPFNLGPALIVHGAQADSSFEGFFEIAGGDSAGIGTIDPDPNDGFFPDRMIRSSQLADGIITGGNLSNPSVLDISERVASNPTQSALLDPNYLDNLTRNVIPLAADLFYRDDQQWTEATVPPLGSYDSSKPPQAPGQNPKIVALAGNLRLDGNVSGAGLLLVSGDLVCSGSFHYSGLILVIGSGRLSLTGQANITGSVYVANRDLGTAALSIGGGTILIANKRAVQMALDLLPASQISFREIAGADP
jgi:hypothetical protein